MNIYNNKVTYRLNKFIRKHFILPRMRRRLVNKNMSILCNNCIGGIVSHELGLRFNSPTVNLYFENNDFFFFLEDLSYYLAQPLVFREMKDVGVKYPVCTLGELGGGKRKIVLHFLHYKSFDEALKSWERRKNRMNKENIFVIYTFIERTDIELVKRFEMLSFKNKVAFSEMAFPQYNSCFHIKGFPNGLGLISNFYGFLGKKKMDQFDFVEWFNSGCKRYKK